MRFDARTRAGLVVMVIIAGVAAVAVSAQKNQRVDPLPAFIFRVEIPGLKTGFFKSVGGLAMETEVVEYREGGDNPGPIRKLAGPTHFANIRLTRGFTGDQSLYNWFLQTQKPNPVRVTGRIIMLDTRLNPVAVFRFVNGFPVKWEGPLLDASTNDTAIETIEIAHEGLVPDDNNQ